MKSSIYPYSNRDRFIFWLGVINTAFAVFSLLLEGYIVAAISFAAAVFNFGIIYILPDKPIEREKDQYSQIIDQLSGMGKTFLELRRFLEQEQKRIAETKDTINTLQKQKAELEPVVATQREIVDAILAAHGKNVRYNVWKDRLIGFMLGVLASLVSAIIFEYFRSPN